MDNPFFSPSILSVCPGFLGLERGLQRAIGKIRVAAYVEIEAFCIANFLAGMEAGVVDAAPVWTDVKTFQAKPFRKKIHGIIGGYPCQPFSLAGQRKGHEDPRHLWPYIHGIIKTTGPVWCLFENVSGHLSMGYDQVKRELTDLGYAVEEGIFTAEEVGAPHERERLFILAISKRFISYTRRKRIRWQAWANINWSCPGANVGNATSISDERFTGNIYEAASQAEGNGDKRQWSGSGSEYNGETMEYANSQRCGETGRCQFGTDSTSKEMADTTNARARDYERELQANAARSSETMGYSTGNNQWHDRNEPGQPEFPAGRPGNEKELGHTNNGRCQQCNTGIGILQCIIGERCERHCEQSEAMEYAHHTRCREFGGVVSILPQFTPVECTSAFNGNIKNKELSHPICHDGNQLQFDKGCTKRGQFTGNGQAWGIDHWPTGPGEEQYEWEQPRTTVSKDAARLLGGYSKKYPESFLQRQIEQVAIDGFTGSIKSKLGGTINGYNFREDLLRAYGNSVVEQTAEIAFVHLLKKHLKNIKTSPLL